MEKAHTVLDQRSQRQIATIQEYKDLFESPLGQKVLADMAYEHHMMGSTYTAGSDFAHLALREGERNVILRIFSILKTDIATIYRRVKAAEERHNVEIY